MESRSEWSTNSLAKRVLALSGKGAVPNAQITKAGEPAARIRSVAIRVDIRDADSGSGSVEKGAVCRHNLSRARNPGAPLDQGEPRRHVSGYVKVHVPKRCPFQDCSGQVGQTMGRPVTTLLSFRVRKRVQRVHGLAQNFPVVCAKTQSASESPIH